MVGLRSVDTLQATRQPGRVELTMESDGENKASIPKPKVLLQQLVKMNMSEMNEMITLHISLLRPYYDYQKTQDRSDEEVKAKAAQARIAAG
ncbi:hypothetical protein F441_07798 [Phytophthora nicotianae CJ01A1]|uniref:Uncharacterized protein n=1 Tax=Phytophthora nicotianae CJ01A1 TaxID=1317063 RepID=W2X579_PHYNI|nr:hypothetical protein F441_07798 [Phytophthora nicotianae CJ01A1]